MQLVKDVKPPRLLGTAAAQHRAGSVERSGRARALEAFIDSYTKKLFGTDRHDQPAGPAATDVADAILRKTPIRRTIRP